MIKRLYWSLFALLAVALLLVPSSTMMAQDDDGELDEEEEAAVAAAALVEVFLTAWSEDDVEAAFDCLSEDLVELLSREDETSEDAMDSLLASQLALIDLEDWEITEIEIIEGIESITVYVSLEGSVDAEALAEIIAERYSGIGLSDEDIAEIVEEFIEEEVATIEEQWLGEDGMFFEVVFEGDDGDEPAINYYDGDYDDDDEEGDDD